MRLHFKRIALSTGLVTVGFFVAMILLSNRDHYILEYEYHNRYVRCRNTENCKDDNNKVHIINAPPFGRETKDMLVWPQKHKQWDDRIVEQMKYVPSSYRGDEQLLKILVPGGLGDNPVGQGKFKEEKCPVNRCYLTQDLGLRLMADAVVYQNEYLMNTPPRGPNQVWVLWVLESPLNSMSMTPLNGHLNWTATYRSDSTIVTPYEKFVHFDNFTGLPLKPPRDYSNGKTKLVAWFVSNCRTGNMRYEYAMELQKSISVDIYGACGPNQCDRFSGDKCDKLLSEQYKFYLAFENSNCKYYITEKFFVNALLNDVVPVVMGGRKEDYEAVAPPRSFIHVEDFENATALANYLLKLDSNPDLYNEYFLWKQTGEFINTKFWCRLCAMLHAVQGTNISQSYPNVQDWWRGNESCTKNSWKDPEDFIMVDAWDKLFYDEQ